MAQANDTIGMIYQNLLDAGCCEEMTERCIAKVKDGKTSELLLILTRYRTSLLGTVREGQKQLDCLDFLIYQIKRNQT